MQGRASWYSTTTTPLDNQNSRAGSSFCSLVLVAAALPFRGCSLRHCAGSSNDPAQMPTCAARAFSSRGMYSLLYCLHAS